MSTVTIPKKEYERLKSLEKKYSVEEQIEQSLKDAKEGRVTKW